MSGPTPAEPISLSTVDGVTLEAQFAPPADASPTGGSTTGQPPAVAVVCHPHPLYGGSMHNNVVDRLFRDLPAAGVATVRFNFRGVGASGGEHGNGRDEAADIVAAIDELAGRYPNVPVVVVGYSFGADVALSVGDDRLAGWLAVSPPLRIIDPATMAAATDPRPTVIVSGTADDFQPAGQAEQVVADWPSTEVVAVDGVDHFWMSGLDQLGPAATNLLDRITATG